MHFSFGLNSLVAKGEQRSINIYLQTKCLSSPLVASNTSSAAGKLSGVFGL